MSYWLGGGVDPSRAERLEALFGGRGEVRVVDLCDPAALPAPFAAALACELGPGASVGAHRQAEHAEVVIFVEGHARVAAGASRIDAAPGTLVPLALGESLSIENASREAPVRYLIVKAGLPSRR